MSVWFNVSMYAYCLCVASFSYVALVVHLCLRVLYAHVLCHIWSISQSLCHVAPLRRSVVGALRCLFERIQVCLSLYRQCLDHAGV